MIYRIPQDQIEDYYQRTSLNQSSIKTIIGGGIQAYLKNAATLAAQEEQPYEEKEHFLIGQAVDTYITQGEQAYLDRYHFSSVKKPGDSIMAVVKKVYDDVSQNGDIGELGSYQREIYDACNFVKYYMNRARPNAKDVETNQNLPDDSPKYITWKNDNRWQDVVKNGSQYFEDLKEARGKQVLSDEQNMLINQIINTLTTHPFTYWVFNDDANTDIIYQLPIYFEIDGIFCKALLDEVRINHVNRQINGIDIKTAKEHVTRFNNAIFRRRYDIQASWYNRALNSKEGRDAISRIIGKDVSNYKVTRFAFVAESTSTPGTPLIFPIDDELELVGELGSIELELDGWRKGVELFGMWERQGFSLDHMFSESNGVVFVNKDFKFNKTF